MRCLVADGGAQLQTLAADVARDGEADILLFRDVERRQPGDLDPFAQPGETVRAGSGDDAPGTGEIRFAVVDAGIAAEPVALDIDDQPGGAVGGGRWLQDPLGGNAGDVIGQQEVALDVLQACRAALGDLVDIALNQIAYRPDVAAHLDIANVTFDHPQMDAPVLDALRRHGHTGQDVAVVAISGFEGGGDVEHLLERCRLPN